MRGTPAQRRRRVLSTLLCGLVLVSMAAVSGTAPGWAVAVPAALLVAWLVICRLSVLSAQAAAGPRRRDATTQARRPGRPPSRPAPVTARAAPMLVAALGAIGVTAIVVSSLDGSAVSASSAPASSSVLAPPSARLTSVSTVSEPGTETDGLAPEDPAVVIASRGAIIYIGDDGTLTANTGPTASSGMVALGVEDSELRSGTSGADGTPGLSGDGDRPGPTLGHGNSSFASIAKQGGDGRRGTSVSGFEDHSVSVVGDDQVVTYDDSNVFIDRDGQINANTGDTDSSGLNAVDVSGSTARAGNSGDSEEAVEVDDEEEEDATSSGLVGGRYDAGPGAPSLPPAAPSPPAGSSDDEDGSGNDEAAEDGIVGTGPVPGQSYGTVTDEGASIARGRDAFVVGADGYDDVSIRTNGNDDVVSYDDSNVVLGGKGDVNAQIGDSDTGGAVVMGLDDSDVSAGCEGDLCNSGSNAERAALPSGTPIQLSRSEMRQLNRILALGPTDERTEELARWVASVLQSH